MQHKPEIISGIFGDRAESYDLKQIAESAWCRSGRPFLADPRGIADELGIQVELAGVDLSMQQCECARTTRARIYYGWDVDQRERGLRIFHALSHALLLQSDGAAAEYDAWKLTGYLVAPECGSMRRQRVTLANPHVPEWFLRSWEQRCA